MNDQYNTYSVDQLISDEQFVDWVLNPTEETDQQWQNWIRQHPDQEERVEEAKSILKNLSFKKMDTGAMAPRIWDRIENDIAGSASSTKSTTRMIRLVTLVAAAAAVLVLLIINWGGNDLITVEISAGMANVYQLPDRSEIHINDGSKIYYNEQDFNKTRDVYLEGEAFFQVMKGSPFTVHTDKGNVEVLGTSFNIFSHGEHFNVVCKTGRVKVTSARNSVILSPGEAVSFDSERNLVKSESETDIDWLDGTFKYQESALSEVTSELERQFNLRIHLPEFAEEIRYTGFFLDNDLEQALNSVFWPLKLKYEQKDNEIFISREN